MRIRPDVAAALADHRPVVALESTLITHGMPYPRNLETGSAMEDAIRDADAVPATIAVIDGTVVIGTTMAELVRLAEASDVTKVSLRDFGPLAVSGGLGGTTVAATMHAAHRAGIAVFATGGIGGVHRGVELTGDVSTDVTAFATIPVAVVSAGVKAILDIPRTLERFETLGVPVIGFRTDRFPAFYTRDSGLPVSTRADDARTVAEIVYAHWAAGVRSGVLIANPIPPDEELDPALIDQIIGEALASANRVGVTGQALTPYLLSYVAEHTDGSSLEANVALAVHNARVAAAIAGALSDLEV